MHIHTVHVCAHYTLLQYFCFLLLYLENEELRKEFAALANEVGDYLEQKAAILANSGLQGGSLEVCIDHTMLLLFCSF